MALLLFLILSSLCFGAVFYWVLFCLDSTFGRDRAWVNLLIRCAIALGFAYTFGRLARAWPDDVNQTVYLICQVAPGLALLLWLSYRSRASKYKPD